MTLTDLLRCPACNARLSQEGREAICRDGKHRFPLVDGVVVMIDDSFLHADSQYQEQRRYFDAEFAKYNHYELEEWRISYLARLRQAGFFDSAPVVDVAVGGSGYTVIEAARAGIPAVGCDLSLEGLRAARRSAVAEGVIDRTLWVCCSAERLPFASASFATAFAIAIIEHLPDDGAALRELARVLRIGGRAWVTVPHALEFIAPPFRPANERHDKRLGHLRRYEAESLINRASAYGLRPVAVEFTGHAIKILQLVGAALLLGRLGKRFWWWCERRDLHRKQVRQGSMQLSMVFERSE